MENGIISERNEYLSNHYYIKLNNKMGTLPLMYWIPKTGCPHVLENLEIREMSWNFFCLGICRGIYYFQSFVLEMSWNFFVQFTNFFSESLFLYFAFSNFVLYSLSLCIFSFAIFLFFRK